MPLPTVHRNESIKGVSYLRCDHRNIISFFLTHSTVVLRDPLNILKSEASIEAWLVKIFRAKKRDQPEDYLFNVLQS